MSATEERSGETFLLSEAVALRPRNYQRTWQKEVCREGNFGSSGRVQVPSERDRSEPDRREL